jgi:hypothetical protein
MVVVVAVSSCRGSGINGGGAIAPTRASNRHRNPDSLRSDDRDSRDDPGGLLSDDPGIRAAPAGNGMRRPSGNAIAATSMTGAPATAVKAARARATTATADPPPPPPPPRGASVLSGMRLAVIRTSVVTAARMYRSVMFSTDLVSSRHHLRRRHDVRLRPVSRAWPCTTRTPSFSFDQGSVFCRAAPKRRRAF